eukprot:gene7876-10692_t
MNRNLSEDSESERGKLSLINSLHEDYKSSSSVPIRRLTFVDGVAILVGIIIGSGIFSSPGLALQRSGSPGAVLLAWCASGVLVVMACYCYIELGTMIPSAGGDFDYLKRAYGERVAFSFAWFNFFVSKTGSQAIISIIFGRYFEAVIRGDTTSIQNGTTSSESFISKSSAVCLIILLTALNCAGIKESAILQVCLTTAKVGLVVIVFVFALVFASYDDSLMTKNLSPSSTFNNSNSILGFGSAMVACLWCFDGYADVNFLQEELMDPKRDLPKIVFSGLAIVTVCYIFINIAYLSVLSTESIIDSKAIAVEFGSAVSNSLFLNGKTVLSLLLASGVALSTCGSANGSIMTGGRAFFAVAREGKAPKIFASLNQVGAPWASLIAQAVWTIVLLMLPGSNFSSLLDYFGPTSWLFYALSASSLIVLRWKEPNTNRPFKVPLYPLPPLIVIVLAMVILISSLAEEPFFTLLAIGFVLLSFPAHFLMEYYDRKEKTNHSLKLSINYDELDNEESVHKPSNEDIAI